MKLFSRKSGSGQPLIILHGLFGSSDNWYSLGKIFAETYSVYLVDQRNHGQSPHSGEFDYKVLTDDLAEFITDNALTDPIILGHSMGGKTAMNFAVKYPDQVKKLIVSDIVPKAYPVHHDQILDGLKAITLNELKSRNEADQILAQFVPEPDVRQFLLKNLSRDQEGKFEWKINLDAIDKHIEEMGDGMQYKGQYNGDSLFVRGIKSNYYGEGDEELIRSIFPNAKFVSLDTGHWVQAEKPKEFMDVVMNFLRS